MVVKQIIYRNRWALRKPHVNAILNELELIHNIEFFDAKRNHKIFQHIKKWSPFYPELTDIDIESV